MQRTESTYNNYIADDGRLLCQLMSLNEYNEYKRDMEYGELKPESVLRMIGYTVNAKDNLSEKRRRTILQYAMNEGVIAKERAISYLKHFLRVSGSRDDMQDAVAKWRADLEWLRDSSIKKERVVEIRRIII